MNTLPTDSSPERTRVVRAPQPNAVPNRLIRWSFHTRKSWLVLAALVAMTLPTACQKNGDSGPSPSGTPLCREVSINADLTQTKFTFNFDDQLRIVGLSTIDDGTTESRTYTYTNFKLTDPAGDVTATYANGVVSTVNFSGSVFQFNPSGQLTRAEIKADNDETLTYAYTYDGNGDPTAITGVVKTSDGKTETNNFVLDYVPDHLNGLPGSQQPEFAWVSTYFYAVPLTSKHLLNKWVRNWTAAGRSFTFTQQYSYQFDAQNRTSQFVHTGNSKNFYHVTYAQCQ